MLQRCVLLSMDLFGGIGGRIFPSRLAQFVSELTSRRELTDTSTQKAPLVCREEFTLPRTFDFRVWFPMHMSVQLKKMEGKLRSVDLIVEVHDARVPISGRNPQFYTQLYTVRPHILVLNKMDLIDMKLYRKSVEDYYMERGVQHIVWTDCKRRKKKELRELQTKIIECIRDEPRFNRTVKTEYQVMVVGIPNVGKSSLINSLRSTNLGTKHSAVAEGARPGVTVRVQNRVRVLDRPPVYVLDTPGVLYPNCHNVHESMKLAICNLILESATKPHYVADYLLFWMNRIGDYSYVDHFKLDDGPSDDIQRVLLGICKSRNLIVTRTLAGERLTQRWDIDTAATIFLDLFRKGKLRDHCLDRELLLRHY
uniref:GTPase 1 n=1 Tax=Ascaris suum TaxID=6253 RepID=F1L2V8_ASCSU